MIAMPLSEIDARARRWARSLGDGASVVDGRSMVGGGSLPEESLPTKLVAIDAPSGAALEALASACAWATRRSSPASKTGACCSTRAPWTRATTRRW